MTPDDLITFAASAAAVAALVFLCWALGFRGGGRLKDEAQVRAIAAQEAPGVHIADLVFDRDGRAAIAWLADGRVLIVRAMGDRAAARISPGAAVKFKTRPDGALRVEATDIGYPPLLLRPDGTGLPDRLTRAAFAGGREPA